MSEMLTSEPVSVHDAGETCESLRFHRPKITHVHAHHIHPIGWGGSPKGEIRWLCPNCHEHTHILLRAYKKHEGTPPWEIRKQFNSYIRALAAEGWRRHNLLSV